MMFFPIGKKPGTTPSRGGAAVQNYAGKFGINAGIDAAAGKDDRELYFFRITEAF